MTPPRKVVKRRGVAGRDLAEKDWQKVLMNGMEEQGWTVNHVGRGRHRSGDWVTPTTSPGYPDLLAVRGHRLLAVEVKGPRTPVDLAQVAWLLLFSEVPTANAWVMRPTMDWSMAARWIAHPEEAPVTFGFDPTMLGSETPAEYLRRVKGNRPSGRGSPGARLSDAPPPAQGTML